MSLASFIHLKTHSPYSLAEGAIRIDRLIRFCQEHSMPAIALTDTMNVFGAMEFSLAAIKAGVQPIIGAKIITNSPLKETDDKYRQENATDYDELVLLATTEEGYKNLIKLLSRSYLQQKTGAPIHVLFESFKQLSTGLIALTGGAKGFFQKLLAAKDLSKAQQYLRKLQECFPDRLYLEVERFSEGGASPLEEPLIQLAYEENIPLVATNEAFFVTPEQHDAHDALLCIADGTYLSQTERRRVTHHHRLKTPSDLEQLFRDLPEAIVNTHHIAQRCHFILAPIGPKLPSFPTGKGETQELHDQAHQGLTARLEKQILTPQLSKEQSQGLIQEYTDRLDFEIRMITKMGYAGYYLIVADFIQWAKSQNIPVGPGRGSGAGSLVAWALTITDVDPIAMNLYFERFLNPERVSMPDFDIDFCQDRRDEVIDYVCQKYGADRVAQIITFGKLQARAALRDVGRVTGMPYNQVDQICKLIPNNPANPVSLSEALEQEPELQEQKKKDPAVNRLFDIALQLEGLYRHASTHAAGVVIGGEPLENLVALYHDGQSKLPATQFNMKYVESAGLIKFDFLGLKTLTVIQHAIDLLRKRQIEINISALPLEDGPTFELLRRVEVVGIFQLESPGMRDVLRKLQPTRFGEIVDLVALYRPGPMDDIPRYLACKHGAEPVTYAHPLMESILKDSFGVMVYQEHVMQIAQHLAGYSLGQADLLRRAMGKKIKSEMDAQRAIFIKGCYDHHQIDPAPAHQIFDQMAKFASYGFPKGHAAPYALISYQTAYLKANYPVEFLAALLTADIHNTDKLNLIREELLRLKIPLLPPDINKSYPDFHVEETDAASLAIRYALAALKNIGKGAMEALVEEREKNGPFKNVFDFVQRLEPKYVNKRLLENLIAGGAFDSLEPNRAKLMNALELINAQAGALLKLQQSQQKSLFGEEPTSHLMPLNLPEVSPWTSFEKSQREFDAVGFYLSEHPLDHYQSLLKRKNILRYRDLYDQRLENEGTAVYLAGVVLSAKERVSKSGQKYAFVQFSDTSGLFEGVVFSDLYIASRGFLETGNILVLRATARKEGETIRLAIHEFQKLEQLISQGSEILAIKLTRKEALPGIRDLLAKSERGATCVTLECQAASLRCQIELPHRYQLGSQALEELHLIPHIESIELR